MGAPLPGFAPHAMQAPASLNAEPAPPAMAAPIAMAASPTLGIEDPAGTRCSPLGAPEGSVDIGLAASPWNRGNHPSFNRDLLPSAMVAPASEPLPPEKKPAKAPEPPAHGEEPSRAPWIIVGVLVLVAIAGGVLAFQVHARRTADGQIAVPVGATATEDTPADMAPTASVSAAAKRAPAVVRPFKPKPTVDDPYDDVPVTPTKSRRPAAASPAAPPTAPHRVFGSED
jgi:hypothetical protein